MIWVWLAVLVNCHGDPEDGITYRARVLQPGWAGWVVVAETPDTWLEYDLPVPGLGSVTYLQVDAVDGAGNTSDQPCPPWGG